MTTRKMRPQAPTRSFPISTQPQAPTPTPATMSHLSSHHYDFMYDESLPDSFKLKFRALSLTKRQKVYTVDVLCPKRRVAALLT